MMSQQRRAYPLATAVACGAMLVAGTVPSSGAAAPAAAAPQPTAAATSGALELPPMDFDPSQPFEVIEGSETTQPHVDTTTGRPLTAEEVDAVFEQPSLDSEGRALSQASNTYHWRDPNNPNDPSAPDILITADSNVPQDVINLMGEVFVEWRQSIDLDIPAPEYHHVQVTWSSSLATGVLGGALTGWVSVSQNGSTYVVPRFLANVNGAATNASSPALNMVLNANIDWDFTTDPDDSQANSKYYLKTVLLHEVGHSLGVASGADYLSTIDTTTLSTWGASFYGGKNESAPLTTRRSDIVESNDLWTMNTDGTWEKIYDPLQWSQGSSLSHLDENTYTYQRGSIRTPGALMTPFLTNGEVNNVDGVIAGLLSRAGYETFLSPAAPAVTATSANGVLTVNVSPGTNDVMEVPAKQWMVSVRDQGGAVVRSTTLDATERQVQFGGFASSGTYQVTVTAEIDGQTAAAAAVPVSISTEAPTTIADATSLFGVIYATDYAAADADTMRLYRAFFERDPDLDGIKYWIAQSRAGVSYDEMAWGFAHSTEFTTTYENLTNQQFLQVVYRNVLGRDPDQAGFDYWYGEVQAGLARHLAVRWIAESAEFNARHPYLPE